MPREAGIDLEKVTLNIIAGDKETLADYYPALGWSVAARRIVHKHCKILREKDSQEVQASLEDLELPAMKDVGS